MKIAVRPLDKIAGDVADMLASQLEAKPRSVLGMTTGSTPITLGIYREWVRRVQEKKLDLSQALFVNPDELLEIPLDHPESYRSYMYRQLFAESGIPSEHIYNIDTESKEPKAECRRFETLLSDLGGIDWQLLGLGRNGHITFIEPDSAIPAAVYVVNIAEENRAAYAADFGSLEAVPKHAITVGLKAIMTTRKLVLVATGTAKSDIVEKALLGPITTMVPASFIQLHNDVTIILDESAAAKLPAYFTQRNGQSHIK
jgi:glucosamine-6-phosphate deaminase